MRRGCQGCKAERRASDIAMAFQPIVDAESGRVFAYEALVRGPRGESAGDVLVGVSPENCYAFDQQCRVSAIEYAVAAGILETDAKLSINFLPNAVYSPVACIQLTLQTARRTGLPLDRLIFEFTENEQMADTAHVRGIIEAYREFGFCTALDDFGAGHAGLALLAKFQTDFLKLDMELVRDIDTSQPRRAIVESLVRLAESLDMEVIAEGIETAAEYDTLREIGVRYLQGYLLGRPELARLPLPELPA